MAKKRKAGGQPKTPQKSDENPNKRVRMNIDSYEDVAGSDDDFHINRDKVLLGETPDAKRRRQWQEKDEFLEASDEDVMVDSDEAEDDESDENEVFTTPAPHRSAMPRDYSDDEDDAAAGEEDDDLERWGTTKQDYYGADDMETEQDALDEEAEAKRIQQKQLQGMTAADYGFDEDEWQDSKKDASKEKKAVVTEVLPQMQISEDMSPAERLKLLKSRYPEFEPLSKDFLDLQDEMKELRKDAIHAQEFLKSPKNQVPESFVPVAITKHRAASTYITVLSMYFALLTSQAKDADAVALPLNVLRDHPVMDSLLKSREMWLKAKDLPGEELVGDDLDEDVDGGIEDADEDIEAPGVVVAKPKKKRAKKTKAQKAAAAADAEAEARRAERMAKTEADLMDLDALVGQKSSKRKKKASKPVQFLHNDDDSDLGDETELTAQEQADKDRKRKSLRFYTSQIAQKANKRGAAGRNAGGDDDIPYRERLKDKQARLMAEAEKRGRKPTTAGEEIGGESDEEDRRQAKEIRGEKADSEDDYYDMVAARSSKKKSEKKALADAQREAAASGGRVVEQEVVGEDGKRKISYLIEKNKGLTPHRKKDVRNPRVKKRKKYEEKTKKLASMKPTYKGGEGRGGYAGELTGIKSGIVKSTKL
ncbi:hypothetical protein MBLNU457_5522t2 [Dothideomycetes sp. NU457]